MRSMSKLMCVVASTAMMFSTSTLATAGWGPCDYPLKPTPCNADVSGACCDEAYGVPDGIVNIDDMLYVIEAWNEVGDGSSRPHGDIAPLDTGDCVVDINDLLMVLENWNADASGCGPCGIGEIQDCLGNCVHASWLGDSFCDDGSYSYNGNDIYLNCPDFDCDGGDCAPDNCSGGVILGACWLPTNSCSVLEEDSCSDAGGLSWVAEADCTDTDSDRIPNVFERNDCSEPSNGFTGTDPDKADTDGDSLKDGDEIYGTLAGLDLPSFGCDACHKDLLVHVDWTAATEEDDDLNKLHADQAARVVTAFDDSPMTNPDGETGVKLHIDYGQAPYSGGQYVEDPDGDGNIEVDEWPIGLDGGEMAEIKKDNFPENRQGYFHYCVMANSLSVIPDEGEEPDPKGWSGQGNLPGDDFIVTVGSWGVYGDDDMIGNTFMHELGHNLNLKHSGSTHSPNYEPNFNSVMNYTYQLCGVDDDDDGVPDGVLDYSHGDNADLDEDALDESLGVTGSGPALDWNENGIIDEDAVEYNINCRIDWCSSRNDFACGWSSGAADRCGDTSCGTLTDNNDWAQVSFTGLTGLVPSIPMRCDPLNLIDDE
ncbi:MAG: GC-type dockerin domain-anchored protein [Planctomycetota bacterium]|nr:GC-type dockerin domain-anchored protein [Planctomycetota bacterium]